MASWRVKYDGVCSRCGTPLLRGQEAVWERATRSMHCMVCPEPDESAPGNVGVAAPLPAIDEGVAGGSARREHERRAAKREARIEERFGRFAGVVKAVTEEPQSIRAWGIGARGEEKLAQALAGIGGLRILHDRRVPGTRGNIDHIVIASAGVFVVDAKNLDGLIEIRNRGWFFRPDWRLYVGGRDRSKLAEGMTWQVESVRRALVDGGVDPLPPITPILCFVDGRWPLIRPPDEFGGVLLESDRSIRKVLTREELLDPMAIESLVQVLGRFLPSK